MRMERSCQYASLFPVCNRVSFKIYGFFLVLAIVAVNQRSISFSVSFSTSLDDFSKEVLEKTPYYSPSNNSKNTTALLRTDNKEFLDSTKHLNITDTTTQGKAVKGTTDGEASKYFSADKKWSESKEERGKRLAEEPVGKTLLGMSTAGQELNIANNYTIQRNSILPQWMFDYFKWHKEQLEHLSEENWETKRYLIPRCLMVDRPCGGTSDRLQSLPFMIKLAIKTGRILFYKWTRPCNLEEFLLPAVPAGGSGGINWTLPNWLHERFRNHFKTASTLKDSKQNSIYFAKSTAFLITFIFQSKDYGRGWYQKGLGTGEPTWEKVYSELWHRTFVPSPAVAGLIESSYRSLNLKHDDYVAVHVRSHWRNSGGPTNLWVLRQALNCSSHLPSSDSPASQIYFAADDHMATKLALEYGRGYRRADMVARSANDIIHNNMPHNPFHLDFNQSTQPSDYYDTFVDLYLMSNARCVAYGKGGFAKWSTLINRHQCSVHYMQMGKCRWNRAMHILPEGVL